MGKGREGKGREGEERGRKRRGEDKGWEETQRESEGREEGKGRGPEFENPPPPHQMAAFGPARYKTRQ